jgi:1,2-diacylglycerol 3-alpha-glucosyltransferase
MLRLPPHKAGIWPSSVDLSVFDPKLCSEQEISEVRRKLDLDGKVAVIYHGAISRGRGIMEAVKAMGLLKQVGTNVKLVLLGYGPFRQEIRRYVEVEGLEDVVTVPDPVQIKGVAKYLAASDVEIIPMPDHVWWRYQCFIKVLECLAMNKPLISTDLPAVRAVVDEVPVVQWMTGSTALHIADALQGYIKTRGLLRPSLGRAIASKYSVETIAKNVEAYIEACRHRR